jgi:acyl-CoA synthetase (NDP forming)
MEDGDRSARLKSLFHPRSIALVGATDNSRWSSNTYQNLRQCQFPGPIHLVHPVREVVHGAPAVKRLRDIPEPPDLVYVMVPTSQVLPVLGEAAELGIHNAVVLTAGFGEVGDEGVRLQRTLRDFAEDHAFTILGPNGNGFINASAQIVPYGLPITLPLRKGPIGVMLQSGALASTAVSFIRNHAMGLSLLVSMGNEMQITATDVMDYLVDDPDTRVIAMFLESIREAERFRRVAQRALRAKKPVVVLKVGQTAVSQRTALVHTGALVGDDAVNDAALRDCGVIRVESFEDLMVTAGFLGYYGPPPGSRAGVITASGGASEILADRAAEEGIELPDFSPSTKHRLTELLPSFGAAHNPLDVTGYVVVDGTLTERALGIAVDDPGFDFLMTFVSGPADGNDNSRLRAQWESLAAIVGRSPHPVYPATQTLQDISQEGAGWSESLGLRPLGGIHHGMAALGRALWWKGAADRARVEASPPTLYGGPWPRTPRGVWGEQASRELLAHFDLPMVPALVAGSEEEAARLAAQFGGPVALKVAADALLHKTDVGGVRLNLTDAESVRAAYQSITQSVQQARPGVEVSGVAVSPMRADGVELLVSVTRDPAWGLVLTVALGGLFVEILRDRTIRLLPVPAEEVRRMLDELKGRALLQGARGQAAADLGRLADVIARIARTAAQLGPQLQALEINPLWVRGADIEILDALVVFEEDSPGGREQES